MSDIEKRPFWQGLNNDIKGYITTLITKSEKVKLYKRIQLVGSIIGVLVSFIYYFLTTDNYSFDSIFNSSEFYVFILIIGIYSILLEKMIEPLQREIENLKKTIRIKMILKICHCHGYCECKEDVNDYMKREEGITIFNIFIAYLSHYIIKGTAPLFNPPIYVKKS